MQKVSNIIGKLEIAVSLFSLTIHSIFASFAIFSPEAHDQERPSAGIILLIAIFVIMPSLLFLLGSYLHARKYKEGGVIILFTAIPMLGLYFYLGLLGLYGMESLLSLQFMGIVTFILIPITMFVLAVMQEAKISTFVRRSDLS
ncbi:MAG TPA: hypothetical protein VK612_03205 [Pyrinomonadaceae bacterium]|nr:hypothetical protein [Pyrinomonadaceae bacterium]